MNLSENFTLAEASITSNRTVDNSVKAAQTELITTLTRCALKLEKVRAALKKPVLVNSWYRCIELNRALGSLDTSDHVKGQAVDFICPSFGSPLQIVKELIKHKEVLGFKQLIYEHTWVHISWNLVNPSTLSKLEVLTLLKSGKYAVGITDKEGKPI